MCYTVTALKTGPVHIIPLGWALTATFLLLYLLAFSRPYSFPTLL
jgi:hypothetical protein